MLHFRWLKHRHYMNNNTRKYLAYAAGEIALVIVGIFIALQIDAWYEDRQIRQNLQTQLQGVAESIALDVANIAQLKQARADAIVDSNRLTNATGTVESADAWYNRRYVEFASGLISASQEPVYFVANTGAYRALESSGSGNHLRDINLKRDLHDYYATVERIVFAEREMNSFIRELTLKYQTEITRGLFRPFLREPVLAWENPELDTDEEYFIEFRAAYREVLLDSVTQALARAGRNQSLLREYEHLLTLGRVLVDQVDAFNGESKSAYQRGEVFDADGGTGPARVFHNGRFEAHSLGLFEAPTASTVAREIDGLRLQRDHLQVNYPGGEDWVFVYARVGPIEISVSRQALDYSRFDRIRLELKRRSGCEDLRLVLKDSEDADDGSQVNVKLELTGDWAHHEYDLSQFSDADLSQLHVVAGFLMGQSPCSFSIRDVTFLEPGQT